MKPTEPSPSKPLTPEAEAFFAGGCFWGIEYLFEREPGVLRAESGYMGGWLQQPTYEQVCRGDTGHVETVRVVYDPTRTRFETLARLFFEIHDPTQVDRQGPDVGEQYRSAIFYKSTEQQAIAKELMGRLQARGLRVATRLDPAGPFWKAEEYHQDYLARTGRMCSHHRVRRFGEK